MAQSENILQAFRMAFFSEPDWLVRAPGRVNLIGEHTDYNDGFVMPGALRQSIYLAASGGGQPSVVVARALDLGEDVELPLGRIAEDAPLTGQHWADLLIGVVREFKRRGSDPKTALGGTRVVVGGDLPSGSGLSSSSALGATFALWLNQLLRTNFDGLDLARIVRGAEQNAIGIQCGIMDQYTIFHARKGEALLLDCRSLTAEPVSLAGIEARFELWQSNVPHELHETAYNERRAACERVVNWFESKSVTHLRDLTIRDLEKAGDSPEYSLTAEDLVKARFVINENGRVLDFRKAIENRDLRGMGDLLQASHLGLSRDYQVSCEQTDFIVEMVCASELCFGARMIGGGFGGSVLVMLQAESDDLFEGVKVDYRRRFDLNLERMEVEFAGAAAILPA